MDLDEAFADRIICLNNISEIEMINVYRSSDVFLFPSLYEGFGVPVLEAQAMGVPVVCSARGGLAEVAGTAAEIREPDDVDGMVTAILELIEDRALWSAQRQAGLRHAGRFSQRVWRDAHRDAYAMLSASRGGGCFA
jgi:glycosyltransferase involved in cell wall biosynthesis